MAFSSTLSSLTDPQATDRLNSPSHSAIEQAQNAAIEQIEAVIGTDASVLGTIIGDLRNTTSGGGGHVQTANKGGTGQTVYTKGDLLVAQSSSVLSKLGVGSNNQVLTADSSQASGVKWAAGYNTNPTIRVYSTASTLTWSKPSTLSYIEVEMVGGGGGGGGAASGSGKAGGGGGSGGYARKIVIASTLGTTETVIIGALGGGGAGASSATGSAGGMSKFGSYASVVGGSGGASATSPGGAGGAGGSAANGDFNLTGGSGGNGRRFAGTAGGAGGDGADSFYGGGAKGIYTADTSQIAGVSAVTPGAGGSGAHAGASGGADVAGGNGAAGLVIVYEY